MLRRLSDQIDEEKYDEDAELYGLSESEFIINIKVRRHHDGLLMGCVGPDVVGISQLAVASTPFNLKPELGASVCRLVSSVVCCICCHGNIMFIYF